jgi:hypothetical protein
MNFFIGVNLRSSAALLPFRPQYPRTLANNNELSRSSNSQEHTTNES